MARKQQEKSRQTRDELMAAALEIFGDKGFAAATISQITEQAGYAKGNFYRYWKSKDEIFLDIMQFRLESYREQRVIALRNAADGLEALGVLIDFLMAMMQDEQWAKVFLEFTVHASSDPGLRHRLDTRVYRLSSELFAELLSPYSSDRAGLEKLGALVTALYEGYMIQRRIGNPSLTPEDLRNAMIMLGTPYLNT